MRIKALLSCVQMQLSLDQMDLETVTQRFANTDRLWDISRTNPDGREQDGEFLPEFELPKI